MENISTSLGLNLSNQGNTYHSKKSVLDQFNYFVILGLEYLSTYAKTEAIPLSIDISKSGELTINGLNEEIIADNNICIYSDKKVTKSK